MEEDRIVITGMGLVSGFGKGVDTAWNRALKGESAITKLDEETEQWNYENDQVVHVGALVPEIDYSLDALGFRNMKAALKWFGDTAMYGLEAAVEAIEQANFTSDNDKITDAMLERTGVVSGTGIGDVQFVADRWDSLRGSRGIRSYTGRDVSHMLIDTPAKYLAKRYGFTGLGAITVVNACATGLSALGVLVDGIRLGRIDSGVVFTHESTRSGIIYAGFTRNTALSRHEDPETASAPFDESHSGMVMGSGGSALVIELESIALERGAVPLAVIYGIGESNDGYHESGNHMTSPHPNGSGAIRAMNNAIRDADVDRRLIKYVNAHETSTPAGDRVELLALKEVLGLGHPAYINSDKANIGHLLGAAGLAEVGMSVKTIHEGKIHPNPNLHNPIPETEGLNVVGGESVRADVDLIMSNNFGFGGTNNSIIIGRLNNHQTYK